MTVVAGGFAVAMGSGIVMLYAWGIVSKSIGADFGWDRSILSLCLTSFLIGNGVGTLSLGYAVGRYGVRRASLVYLAISFLSLASISQLPPVRWAFYAFFAIYGVAGAAATALPYSVAITRWFDNRRGLALGLVNLGAGFGTVIAPHFSNYMISSFGWRSGFLWIAAIVSIVPILGMLFLVRDAVVTSGISEAKIVPEHGWRSFVFTRHFWLIAFPIVGISITTFGVIGSLVSIMTDRGASSAMAATVLSVAGIGSWVARIAVAYALDRVFAPYLMSGILCLTLGGVACVGLGGASQSLLVGSALIGIGLGSEADLMTYLVSRYFAFDVYSKILGTMWIAWAWGGGIGTYVISQSFRLTQSYESSLIAFAALLAISAIVVLRLGPYIYPPIKNRD
jgi:MFS family permease